MSSTLRLAAMALLIVIAAPMIIGWVWPSGTETIDTWTTEGDIDITPSIATADIPIIDSYSGPMNHYWLSDSAGSYSAYDPVAYTQSPSSIPKLSYTATVESVTTSGRLINWQDFSGYRADYITVANFVSVDMTDGTSYSCSTAVYMPGSNSIYIIGPGHNGEALKASDVQRMTIQGASPSNPVLLTTRTYTQVSGEFVDLSKGFVADSQYSPQLEWFNGMKNHAVELWIRTASISGTATIAAAGTTATLQLVGDAIQVNGQSFGSASAYQYIALIFDSDAKSLQARGLIGADSFTDPSWTVGNSVALQGPSALIDRLTLSGHFEYEVKRTYSEIGTGKGIEDATITPYSYYPHSSWQVSFESPARFGDSITIDGTAYPVVDGSITVIDTAGEEHIIAVRGMAILSLVYYHEDAGEQIQHIYINGHEISAASPDPAYAISLDGAWYVSVTVSDVKQGEQTGYTWAVGSFGLDKTGYCTAGLICSIAVMIGAGLWGRANGTKAMAVIFVTGICAVCYLVMM